MEITDCWKRWINKTLICNVVHYCIYMGFTQARYVKITFLEQLIYRTLLNALVLCMTKCVQLVTLGKIWTKLRTVKICCLFYFKFFTGFYIDFVLCNNGMIFRNVCNADLSLKQVFFLYLIFKILEICHLFSTKNSSFIFDKRFIQAMWFPWL